jgi:phosphoribosylformylglycinamidine cyclo-ligase
MVENLYAGDGVDLRREGDVVEAIKRILRPTFNNRIGKVGEVACDMGAYANLVSFGDYALALTTDGVGSKVLVAQALGSYESVGIDCVAMNVNDLLCVGAEPIAMVDYIAMQNMDLNIAKDIARGLAKGAKEANIAIIGGETASLAEVIRGVGDRGFDLAGAALGIVKKDKIITGEDIVVGDIVLGFASSGIHSNGLGLARGVLPRNMWVNILTPTRIYVNEMLEVFSKFGVHGVAHITGGGFLNLNRLTDCGFSLDSLPDVPLIFKKIQELGGVSDDEMYRTFNMGVGMCVVASEHVADKILKELPDSGISRIGSVVQESGVSIVRSGDTLKLTRVIY